MTLRVYKKKRNFKKTPEPKGKKVVRKKLIYLIHKHKASHLHYDLRLAWEGYLKSWAIPKGPSYNPQKKRLAVQVEDHPMDYAKFEGNIPKGEYGAGAVMLWDKGTWEPLEEVKRGLKKGKLTFILRGKKLKGEWSLIRTGLSTKKPSWLLIKKNDTYAKSISDSDLLKTVSVKTGKTMREIQSKA